MVGTIAFPTFPGCPSPFIDGCTSTARAGSRGTNLRFRVGGFIPHLASHFMETDAHGAQRARLTDAGSWCGKPGGSAVMHELRSPRGGPILSRQCFLGRSSHTRKRMARASTSSEQGVEGSK